MGVPHTIQADGRLEQDLRELTDGQLPDVVIDATGSNKSMCERVRTTSRIAGRLVFVGITTRRGQLSASDLPRREGTLLCSRNALSADFARIIGLIEDGRIDTRPWITHRAGVRRADRRVPVVHAAGDRRHQGRRRGVDKRGYTLASWRSSRSEDRFKNPVGRLS